MEVVPIDLHSGRTVTFALYNDVTNAADVVAAVKGNDAGPNVAYLDADKVAGFTAAAAAAHQAVTASTKSSDLSVGSMMAYCLQSTRRRSRAGTRPFDVSTSSKSVLVAVFDGDADVVAAACKRVSGRQHDDPRRGLDALLSAGADDPRVAFLQRAYDVSDAELAVAGLGRSAVARMAVRELR